jgi:hypothetical protein
MGLWQGTAQTAGMVIGFGAVSVAVLAAAPLVLLGGELVNRHYLGRGRVRPGQWREAARTGRVRAVHVSPVRRGPGWSVVSYGCECHQAGMVPAAFLAHPAWIALTSPARWLLGAGRPPAGRHGRGGPPPAGVREPRRPRPHRPAGSPALPEPRFAP